MESRQAPKADRNPSAGGVKKPQAGLKIIRLEPRIAPKIATNHNETLIRSR